MRATNRFSLILPFCLFLAVGITVLPRARGFSPPIIEAEQEDDCEKAHPWQHKVDGKCVDKPHVHHYEGQHHDPGAGETCWIECWCRDGQSPGSVDCGSCSFAGTVCVAN